MERNPLPHLLRARDWQDRSELDALSKWWRRGGTGVAALVGIGGAGKTAIADRFLQILPGAYPEHAGTRKDVRLRSPARLLGFSFYEAPNPDAFFAEIAAWLNAVDTVSYSQILRRLAAAGRCLLILDGLEKVQDDGLRGGAFGHLPDGRLRDLVLGVADGYLPDVSMIVTSRFRLFDPLAERASHYTQIDVERLDRAAAIQLLRDRGVRGTDKELGRIAEAHGFHALSVDLAGGYIALFCDGDSGVFERLPAPPEAEEPAALDPRIAAIRQQERRFARLAARYHDALAERDPAALALLQRVCLFRLGVDAATLTAIFTGSDKEHISGASLARLTAPEVCAKLKLLAEMRLIEELDGRFTVHPAVGDGFVKRIDAETLRVTHAAAGEGLETSLIGKTETNPSDAPTLDLLEEIVYHSISAGRTNEAFGIYWNRIGHSANLAWRHGAYERGERICRAFADRDDPATATVALSEDSLPLFFSDWALYLLHLGELEASARANRRFLRGWGPPAIVAHLNLAYISSRQGHLLLGFNELVHALALADGLGRADKGADAYDYYGLLATLRGDAAEAFSRFAQGLRESGTYHVVDRGSYEALLFRLGRFDAALQTAQTNRQDYASRFGDRCDAVAACDLLMAEIQVALGEEATARELHRDAHEWVLMRDEKYLLCWSLLVSAKIELHAQNLAMAASAVGDGLRLATTHGFGILHIDLLLLRARIALAEGRPADANDDVRVAVGDGLPGSRDKPSLIAASDHICRYAWAIAEGGHLAAESILLEAAQGIGSATLPVKVSSGVRAQIAKARKTLDDSIGWWRHLRDPDSAADINPQGLGARETLNSLALGTLTSYPLRPKLEEKPEQPALQPVAKRFRVALSYPGDERALVAAVADELAERLTQEKVFYDRFFEYELSRPNLDVYLQDIYRNQADLVVVFVCSNYEKRDWCHLEWRAIRTFIKERRDDELMFVRTDAGEVAGLFPIDGCLDAARYTPVEIADAIMKRLTTTPPPSS